MTDQNPITPPPELVEHHWNTTRVGGDFAQEFAAFFAQWGADQELEACCAEMNDWGNIHHSCGLNLSNILRAARRPKPPSLKEQALAELVDAYDEDKIDDTAFATIRRALEALDD